MWTKITIPKTLYRSWPWLCLAMSGGFMTIGMPVMALILNGYACWTLWRRRA